MKRTFVTVCLFLFIGGVGWAQGAAEKPEAESILVAEEKTAETPAVRDGSEKAEKPAVDVYGYLKLDVAYDSAEVDSGNCPTYVLPKTAHRGSEGELSVTARESRLGLMLKGPELGATKTGGRLEGDFYSGSSPEDAPFFRVRLAYLEVDWPAVEFAVLAGQAADLIGPLVPPTINYQVLRRGGNIDYRHPQLRLTKGISFGSAKVTVQAALVRTVLSAGTTETSDTGYGSDASFPTVQGRMALSVPLLTEKPTVLGLWGHYGREEIHSKTVSKDFHSWSGGLDLSVPIAPALGVMAEVWLGANLDAYNGGIGQGLNVALLEEVPAMGGWTAVSLGPVKSWTVNVGGGFDQPDAAKLNANDRELNLVVFGNVWYGIHDAVKIGVEPAYLITAYKGQTYSSALRLQGAMMYTF